MKYEILSKIPGRIRLRLKIPRGYSPEELLTDGVSGVRITFKPETRSLLIEDFEQRHEIEDLLQRIGSTPIVRFSKTRKRRDREIKNKKPLIASLLSHLISPLLPLPLRIGLFAWGSYPFVYSGLRSILRGKLNVEVLDATAIVGSVLIGDYRTASTIVLFLRIGSYLNEWIQEKSRDILLGSLIREEQDVWVIRNGREVSVSSEELRKNDLVIVRAGNTIPCDGVVIDGEAMVNQASLTGEPLPVEKRLGSYVYAGTVVEEGKIIVRAERVGSETSLARLIQIIENSMQKRSQRESNAEKLANRLVPLSFAIACLTLLLTGNIRKSISTLVIDYSCAIKLFTPLAFISAIAGAARRGIVIKGAKYLELLAEAKTFVFDKTGTLTEASPEVEAVLSLSEYSERDLLKIAACVEEHFPHPVATAIVRRAKELGIVHEEEHSEVRYIAAHGIVTELRGKIVIIGSRHFVVEDSGINDSCFRGYIDELTDRGFSVLYIAIDGKLAGIILLKDPLRGEAYELIERLRARDIRILMVTGDNRKAARKVADSLSIEEHYAEVLPEDKVRIVDKLRHDGVVVMVGDGMNDSPAIASSHVGISLRSGADIAKEVSDVLILNGNLLSIIHVLELSREIVRKIEQNYAITIGINSALVLSGLFGFGRAGIFAFIHNATTIITALNSLSLINFRGREALP